MDIIKRHIHNVNDRDSLNHGTVEQVLEIVESKVQVPEIDNFCIRVYWDAASHLRVSYLDSELLADLKRSINRALDTQVSDWRVEQVTMMGSVSLMLVLRQVEFTDVFSQSN